SENPLPASTVRSKAPSIRKKPKIRSSSGAESKRREWNWPGKTAGDARGNSHAPKCSPSRPSCARGADRHHAPASRNNNRPEPDPSATATDKLQMGFHGSEIPASARHAAPPAAGMRQDCSPLRTGAPLPWLFDRRKALRSWRDGFLESSRRPLRCFFPERMAELTRITPGFFGPNGLQRSGTEVSAQSPKSVCDAAAIHSA